MPQPTEWPDEIELVLTANEIRYSRPQCAYRCPVAHAAARAINALGLGNPEVYVAPGYQGHVVALKIWIPPDIVPLETYSGDHRMASFIRRFDASKVRPIPKAWLTPKWERRFTVRKVLPLDAQQQNTRDTA